MSSISGDSNALRGSLLTSWKVETHWKAWRSQPRMASKAIPRTKFWIMKAPMSTVYEDKFGGDRYQFQVSMFLQRMMSKGVAVEMVIDCSALDIKAFERDVSSDETSKSKSLNLYASGTSNVPVKYMHNINEWKEWDVDYVRLAPTTLNDDGTDCVPSEDIIREFIRVASKHWLARPKSYIAIFDCRAGMGTAAFLAASYMCSQLRAPVHVAVASIKDTQAPGIFDHNLLADLQFRYKGKRDIAVPSLPEWLVKVIRTKKESSENIQKISAHVDKTIKQSPMSTLEMPPPPPKRNKKNIPIEKLPDTSSKYLRAITVLKQLTIGHVKDPTWPFPLQSCALSNSILMRKDFSKQHYVTWSAKGRRGLMLFLSDGAFFIERRSAGIDISFLVGMWVPSLTDVGKPQHRTLLDGIIVIDKETSGEGSKEISRYLIFDVLAHEGGILTQKPFTSRVRYIQDGVIGAQKRAISAGRFPTSANDNIRLRYKDHFELKKVCNFVCC